VFVVNAIALAEFLNLLACAPIQPHDCAQVHFVQPPRR
jgi:hypothetical protein